MVVRNAVVHDARVLREAETLSNHGYRVILFGIKPKEDMAAEEDFRGVHIVRLTPQSPLLSFINTVMNAGLGAERLRKRAARRRGLLGARLDRQRRMLSESAAEGGMMRALAEAYRSGPRTAIAATVLVPVVLVRGRRTPARPAPGAAGDSSPPERASLLAKVFRGTYRLMRRVLMKPRSFAIALAFLKTAAKAMADAKPDVYHCHDFNTVWAGYRAVERWKAPLVYDSHEIYAHQNVPHPTRRRRWFVQAVERTVLKRAAAVITVNESIADYLAKKYRIARPVVVMNVPWKSVAVEPASLPEPFRADGLKILYLGGIMRGRGLEEAIHATALLPDARLIMMGPVVRPMYQEGFAKLAADLGIADRVYFVPPVPPEAVTAVASHATVGLAMINNICLSYFYSLPNKIFESMHAGLPVVASDFPEIKRIVEGYEVGVTCDPEDAAAIAAAIRRVLSDPVKYEQMRENARAAAGLFTWDREAEKLVALYARITK
jgi:glycosyltransferase involved in cell wall biosynthesis